MIDTAVDCHQNPHSLPVLVCPTNNPRLLSSTLIYPFTPFSTQPQPLPPKLSPTNHSFPNQHPQPLSAPLVPIIHNLNQLHNYHHYELQHATISQVHHRPKHHYCCFKLNHERERERPRPICHGMPSTL
ncbi:hypothetical protein HYC85_024947 [Camellia sinensis]|uniref:Uncharacterized protein n=1 Tax=Camellia sinensis TaxID=4442 RepID=A0A7J7GBV9_CAMSI|nr:hypothetical protein HYC85_024947 [Camellia sinensis]